MKDRQKLFGFGMSLGSSTQIASTIMSLSLICIASLMIMDGQLTLGTLVAFQVVSSGFIAPLLNLAGLTAKLQETKTQLARLKDALNHPLAPQTTILSKDHNINISGDVTVKNITFGYAPLEAPTVCNVNLHIPHQKTLGIVGKSGSGKSTLALLIAGLYEPTEGDILIDKQSLWDMDQVLRKRAIAFIDSDIGIFEGTLQDNLTLFQPDISASDITKAIKDACLDDVMESVNGLQGFLNENGGNLSGGQRQRVEIARALIQNAKILILDEATSALDPILEGKIFANLRKIGCTVIIISHRLSSLKFCDQIAVMDNGHLVTIGSHKKLMKTCLLYKQLVSHE
jgi:ABC-type bacteriocin/lantibiotic exporter with double-glycine peptidase domain